MEFAVQQTTWDGGLCLRFRAENLSVRSALARIREHSSFRTVCPDRVGHLEIVLAEVLNNIVEHAFKDAVSGEIQLSLGVTERGIRCTIVDTGAPMRESRLPAPFRPVLPDASRDLPEGGFGWSLIADLTNALHYERRDGRNVLTFRIPR